jgi:hypothetical protein
MHGKQVESILGTRKNMTKKVFNLNNTIPHSVHLVDPHRKSKGVLILRTISRHNAIFHHNQKTDTTTQLYCTLSTYVTPKTISRQNQKTNTMPQLYCRLSS